MSDNTPKSRGELERDVFQARAAEDRARKRYNELAAKVEALGEADREQRLAARTRAIAEEALDKHDREAAERQRRVIPLHRDTIEPDPQAAAKRSRLNGKGKA